MAIPIPTESLGLSVVFSVFLTVGTASHSMVSELVESCWSLTRRAIGRVIASRKCGV